MAVHHIPQTSTFTPTGRKTTSTTKVPRWMAPVVGATVAAAAVAGIIGLSLDSNDTTAVAATISNVEYNGMKTALAESMTSTQSATATLTSYQLVDDAIATALTERSAAASIATNRPDQFFIDAAVAGPSAAAATVSSYQMVEDAIASAIAERSVTATVSSYQLVEDAIASALADKNSQNRDDCKVSQFGASYC